MHNSEIVNDFYQYCEKFKAENKSDFIIKGLTIPKQWKIWEEFYITFDIFATKAKSAPRTPLEYVVKNLIANLSIEGSTSQYFRLFGRLIEETNDSSIINPSAVFSTVIERIKDHESCEMKGDTKKD